MVAVAAQLFHLGVEVSAVLPTVEQGHLVAALQRRLDKVTPHEHGPAQDQ